MGEWFLNGGGRVVGTVPSAANRDRRTAAVSPTDS